MIGSGGVAPPSGAERDGGKSTVSISLLPWVPAGVTKQIWETNVPAGFGIKTKRQK